VLESSLVDGHSLQASHLVSGKPSFWLQDHVKFLKKEEKGKIPTKSCDFRFWLLLEKLQPLLMQHLVLAIDILPLAILDADVPCPKVLGKFCHHFCLDLQFLLIGTNASNKISKLGLAIWYSAKKLVE
jgi:hypothetical protein